MLALFCSWAITTGPGGGSRLQSRPPGTIRLPQDILPGVEDETYLDMP